MIGRNSHFFLCAEFLSLDFKVVARWDLFFLFRGGEEMAKEGPSNNLPGFSFGLPGFSAPLVFVTVLGVGCSNVLVEL